MYNGWWWIATIHGVRARSTARRDSRSQPVSTVKKQNADGTLSTALDDRVRAAAALHRAGLVGRL
ncbi:MAG: hypothetical protein WCJ30_28230, partial [Deltaproteobacteria bacterium]